MRSRDGQSYNVQSCTELKKGHYGVRNEGGFFVAWYYVIYDLNGQEQRWLSANVSIGEKASVGVREKATNVWVMEEVKTPASAPGHLRYRRSEGPRARNEVLGRLGGCLLDPL